MILPVDIKPEYSLYYIGGNLIKEMKYQSKIEFDLMQLYEKFKRENPDCSFNQYLFALDWLYLLDLVKLNEEGHLQKCF